MRRRLVVGGRRRARRIEVVVVVVDAEPVEVLSDDRFVAVVYAPRHRAKILENVVRVLTEQQPV